MLAYKADLTRAALISFDSAKITVSNGRATLTDATSTATTNTLTFNEVEGVSAVSNLAVAHNTRGGRLKYLVVSSGVFYKYNATSGVWETTTSSFANAMLLEVFQSDEILSKLPSALGDLFDFGLVAYFTGDASLPSPFLSQVAFDYEALSEGEVMDLPYVVVFGREITADGVGRAGKYVTATLSAMSVYGDKVEVSNEAVKVKIDENGNWSLRLVPNVNNDSPTLVPAAGASFSYYTFNLVDRLLDVIVDDSKGASQNVNSLETRAAYVARVP